MNNSIINSLKRLERLGSENSRLTQKAREAANDIEDKITELMPEGISLPKNYKIIDKNGAKYLIQQEKYYGAKANGTIIKEDEEGYIDYGYRVNDGTRGVILEFAQDIANGLLEEFADFMQKRIDKRELIKPHKQ
jgi:hypothetical protein